VDVYVVNGNKLDIVGYALLFFAMQGMAMEARFLVSRDIQEIILGYDWLVAQQAQWNFLEKKLYIRGVDIPLKSQRERVGFPPRPETPRNDPPVQMPDVMVMSPPVVSSNPAPVYSSSFVPDSMMRGRGALSPAEVRRMPPPYTRSRGRGRGRGRGVDRFLSRESGPPRGGCY
jgi:hypothetical protein